MVVLEINGTDYRIFESWSEITVKKARELFKLSNTAPEELLYIYKEQSKGDELDQDQINLRLETLKGKQDELGIFFKSIFELLSDVPKPVIELCNIADIRTIYGNSLIKFVFGCLYFPIESTDLITEFDYMGSTYHAPESKKIMGTDRPFYNENTDVFCDASDVDMNGRKSEYGKYQMAELLIAIVFREKGEPYIEKDAMEIADGYYQDDITCDIFHAALLHLSKTNETLQILFPNLYESTGDIAGKQAQEASGLSDFGWFTSIKSIATMQLLNTEGLTPLASVQKSNLYDFMTVLSSNRADDSFQSIYRDNISKKK